MGEDEEGRWLPEVKLGLNLIPHIGPAIAQYLDDRQARVERRVAAMTVAAADGAGVSPGDMLQQVLEDPELAALFDLAVDAACRATFDEKLRAIGRALVSGRLMSDKALLDTAPVRIRVVNDLEAVHVRLLWWMREEYLARGTRKDQQTYTPVPAGLALNGLPGGSGQVFENLLETLLHNGLIVEEHNLVVEGVGDPDRTFRVTQFADVILGLFREVGENGAMTTGEGVHPRTITPQERHIIYGLTTPS